MSALAKARKLFGERSEADLEAEVEALRAKRRALGREHNGRTREERQHLVDHYLENLRAVEQLAMTQLGSCHLIPDVVANAHAASVILRDDEFIAAMRAAVDGAPDLSPLSRAEVDAEIAKFDERIEQIRLELARRPVAAKQAEVEAELAALEGGRAA